jgi:hypothetical protein
MNKNVAKQSLMPCLLDCFFHYCLRGCCNMAAFLQQTKFSTTTYNPQGATMKKILFVSCVFTVSILEAQTTNLHTTVTNFWYQGQKAEVLALAQERLNVNTNDMAGLIIKQAYDEEFLLLTSISNSYMRVISLGQSITNENFQALYPLLKANNEHMLDYLTTYHPSPIELLEEQAKGLIHNKPFTYDSELEALHKDGLFEP